MSDKEASHVLTSDNSAEFYANRLGLADQPEVEAVQTEPTEVVEERSEPVIEEKEQEEKPKANPKLERRFSEITKQREEARKEAQQERQAREVLEQRLAALEKQSAPQQAQTTDEEPQPSQFNDAFEYARALALYSTEQALLERDRQQAEAKVAQERQKVIETWASKVQTAKASLPDFDDIVASSDVVIHDDIRDAILESDVGPQILYHLAENEDVAKKISALGAKQALREIGKLEARFEVKEAAPETKPVVRSKAPAPIQPLRGSSPADTPMSTTGEWHGTFQAWKEARKAGKIR